MMLAACLWIGLAAGPDASAYPDQPIRLIVSFPPGGTSDAIARIVQPGVEKLHRPAASDSKTVAGAGGLIASRCGCEVRARRSRDRARRGGALGISLGCARKANDLRKDIAPVTGLAGSPFISRGTQLHSGKVRARRDRAGEGAGSTSSPSATAATARSCT